MAKDKKSFIFYCDWRDTFDELPDEIAGKLIKHLLSYVADEHPETDDLIINAVFANMKNTLKRDLRKWEQYIDKQRLNGSKGGRPKKNPSLSQETQAFSEKPKKADSVSVSVNDNVSVSDIVLSDFNKFWDLYDKKVGKERCVAKWKKLSMRDKMIIMNYLPGYIRHTPDKKYRKNPLTFLNGKGWLDELPSLKGGTIGDIGNPEYYD